MMRDGRSRRVRGRPVRRLATRTDRRSTHHPDFGWCWLWLGDSVKGGYGRVRHGGRNVLAHRWAYELLVGQIPDGMTLDHLCRNPACVRPSHLEAVTMLENSLRAPTSVTATNTAKTRCPKGHPYDESNTYRMPSGGRDCRACINERSARYRARRRSAA